MTWRVLWTEMRRGPAALAGVLTAAAGILIVQDEPIGARWMSLAAAVQFSLYIVVPLVMAIAVWHGGREHHRRLGEMLDGMPRPRTAAVLVRWAGLTAGSWGGLLVVVVFGAVRVAPRASYWGGGWWWILAAAFGGVAAVCAIGMMLGRLLPFRVLAPLIAIGTFALLVFTLDGLPERLASVSDQATTTFQRSAALVPLRRTMDLDWQLVTAHHGLSMLAWLTALTTAALAVMAARRIVVRIAIWVLPVVAAWYLGLHGTVITDDAAALEPVCARGDLVVCVTRLNAYGLPEATVAARESLSRWSGIPEAPTTASEGMIVDRAGRQVPRVGLHLAGDDWYVDSDMWPPCPVWSTRADAAAMVAMAWASADDTRAMTIEVYADPSLSTFGSWDTRAQQDWIGRYVRAARTCDTDGLAVLADELR